MKLTTTTQVFVDGVMQGNGPSQVEHMARLFPGNGPDMALDLVESRAFPQGVTLQVYRPAGRPQYAVG